MDDVTVSTYQDHHGLFQQGEISQTLSGQVQAILLLGQSQGSKSSILSLSWHPSEGAVVLHFPCLGVYFLGGRSLLRRESEDETSAHQHRRPPGSSNGMIWPIG